MDEQSIEGGEIWVLVFVGCGWGVVVVRVSYLFVVLVGEREREVSSHICKSSEIEVRD